jgi:hypothetical protein
MELKVKTYIYIDIKKIIKDNKLTVNSTDKEIKNAISDYVVELDDYEYYLIREDEEEKIFKELKKDLTK